MLGPGGRRRPSADMQAPQGCDGAPPARRHAWAAAQHPLDGAPGPGEPTQQPRSIAHAAALAAVPAARRSRRGVASSAPQLPPGRGAPDGRPRPAAAPPPTTPRLPSAPARRPAGQAPWVASFAASARARVASSRATTRTARVPPSCGSSMRPSATGAPSAGRADSSSCSWHGMAWHGGPEPASSSARAEPQTHCRAAGRMLAPPRPPPRAAPLDRARS